MSLVWMDSFDYYATADLAKLYAVSNATYCLIDTATQRTGRGSFRLQQNTSSQNIRRSISSDAHATIIVGCAVYLGLSATFIIQGLGDGGTTPHTVVGIDGSGSIIAYRTTSIGSLSGSTILGSASYAIPSGVWTYVEAKFVLSDTVGVVEVRLNGNPTPILNVTNADTRNAGTVATYDAVLLGFVGVGGSGQMYVDDLIIRNGAGTNNNDFGGDMRVRCLLPNANGSTNNFTGVGVTTAGSTYQNVDDTTPSMTDYNTSQTAGHIDLYALEDLPTTTGTIAGIKETILALKSDAGSRSIQPTQKSGATTTAGTSQALSTSAAYYTEIRAINPATSAAYTPTEVNALEAGATVV